MLPCSLCSKVLPGSKFGSRIRPSHGTQDRFIRDDLDRCTAPLNDQLPVARKRGKAQRLFERERSRLPGWVLKRVDVPALEVTGYFPDLRLGLKCLREDRPFPREWKFESSPGHQASYPSFGGSSETTASRRGLSLLCHSACGDIGRKQ